jgi:hypothetical protein
MCALAKQSPLLLRSATREYYAGVAQAALAARSELSSVLVHGGRGQESDGVAYREGKSDTAQKVYKATYANLAKEWIAKKLISQLGKLYPNFFPVPIKQVHPGRSETLTRHEKLTQGYLTKQMFVDAYQTCSELVHTKIHIARKLA